MSRIYSRFEPIMDIARFKNNYLFGVDLRDADGNTMDDSIIDGYLNAAIDYLEQELRCTIEPRDEVHYADYYYQRYRKFNYIQLPLYPIVKNSVVGVRLHFDEDIGIDFPQEWFKVYETSGQIQLLPTVSTLSHVLIAQAGQLIPRAITSQYGPQLLKITYKAGIADENGKVPPLINQAIGLYASIYLLQMLGDIGPGGSPGISSQSLSLDGMNQAITTALSATNNLYGATIINYKNQLDKTVMKVLKRTYKRIGLEYI